jgi:hypothetical protein
MRNASVIDQTAVCGVDLAGDLPSADLRSAIKPIEFWFDRLTAGRSRPTKIIGERFYIYASKLWAAGFSKP